MNKKEEVENNILYNRRKMKRQKSSCVLKVKAIRYRVSIILIDFLI